MVCLNNSIIAKLKKQIILKTATTTIVKRLVEKLGNIYTSAIKLPGDNLIVTL